MRSSMRQSVAPSRRTDDGTAAARSRPLSAFSTHPPTSTRTALLSVLLFATSASAFRPLPSPSIRPLSPPHLRSASALRAAVASPERKTVVTQKQPASSQPAKAELRKACRQVVEQHKDGAFFEAKVRMVTEFGAWLDCGAGMPGFLHVHEMAYGFEAEMGEKVKPGDTLKVRLMDVIETESRILLTMLPSADPEPLLQPLLESVPPDMFFNGTVVATTDSGAFIKLTLPPPPPLKADDATMAADAGPTPPPLPDKPIDIVGFAQYGDLTGLQLQPKGEQGDKTDDVIVAIDEAGTAHKGQSGGPLRLADVGEAYSVGQEVSVRVKYVEPRRRVYLSCYPPMYDATFDPVLSGQVLLQRANAMGGGGGGKVKERPFIIASPFRSDTMVIKAPTALNQAAKLDKETLVGFLKLRLPYFLQVRYGLTQDPFDVQRWPSYPTLLSAFQHWTHVQSTAASALSSPQQPTGGTPTTMASIVSPAEGGSTAPVDLSRARPPLPQYMPSIIVGSGRMAQALRKWGREGRYVDENYSIHGVDVTVPMETYQDASRKGLHPANALQAGQGPIYVCVTPDDVEKVILATPPHRRQDLVFTQIGMIYPLLEKYGLQDATQLLPYVILGRHGEIALDVTTELNPDGITLVTGKWAEKFCERLNVGGMYCRVTDRGEYMERMVENVVWLSSIIPVGVKHGGITVGEVIAEHQLEVEDLMEELMAGAKTALNVRNDARWKERLFDYARAVAAFPTTFQEFEYRNGWFWGMSRTAIKRGEADPLPQHTKLMLDLGIPEVLKEIEAMETADADSSSAVPATDASDEEGQIYEDEGPEVWERPRVAPKPGITPPEETKYVVRPTLPPEERQRRREEARRAAATAREEEEALQAFYAELTAELQRQSDGDASEDELLWRKQALELLRNARITTGDDVELSSPGSLPRGIADDPSRPAGDAPGPGKGQSRPLRDMEVTVEEERRREERRELRREVEKDKDMVPTFNFAPADYISEEQLRFWQRQMQARSGMPRPPPAKAAAAQPDS